MQAKKIYAVAKNPRYLKFAIKHKLRSFAWGNLDYYLANGFSFLPITLSLNLTQRCNLDCRMCLQYKKGNIQTDKSVLRYPPEKEMDWPVLKDLVDQAGQMNCMIYLTGGEPFLHPQILKLAQYAKQTNLYLSIVTNGLELVKHAEELVGIGVDNITVSLHGPEQVHDDIAGQKGVFQTATTGLAKLIQERERRQKKLPAVKINHVILNENIDTMPEMVVVARQLSVDAIRFQHPIFESPQVVDAQRDAVSRVLGCQNLSPLFDSYRDRGEYYFLKTEPHQIEKLSKNIAELRSNHVSPQVLFSPDIHPKDLYGYYQDLNHPFYQRCYWPWDTLSVKPNGDVEVCFHYRLGNVKEEALQDLWRGPKMQNFRRALKNQKLFPSCVRCCYRNYYRRLS
jgi:MoaA/NifB/PqqE/SkfB family radical SAM enzyme